MHHFFITINISISIAKAKVFFFFIQTTQLLHTEKLSDSEKKGKMTQVNPND